MRDFLSKCIWGEFQRDHMPHKIKHVSDGREWIQWVQLRSKTLHHGAIIHEGYILCGWCLCVCVSLTTFLSWTRTLVFFFALSLFPNETLLMQTMTSKLYNLEDEWLLYWPLLSSDSALSKHRITTFFWSIEADRDKLTIQNGNIKHYLCIGSENKNLVFTAHCGQHQDVGLYSTVADYL